MAPANTLLQVLQGSEHAPALTIAAGGPTLSRKTLLQLCIDFATCIKAAGLRPGDVVTIADVNTVCMHMCWRYTHTSRLRITTQNTSTTTPLPGGVCGGVFGRHTRSLCCSTPQFRIQARRIRVLHARCEQQAAHCTHRG